MTVAESIIDRGLNDSWQFFDKILLLAFVNLLNRLLNVGLMQLLAHNFFDLRVLGLTKCALLDLSGLMGALFVAFSKMSTFLSKGRI